MAARVRLQSPTGIPRQRLRRDSGPSPQRILGAVVKEANSIAVVSGLVDFEISPEQELGLNLLDREADGLRSVRKPPVLHRPAAGILSLGEKQLCFGAVIERDHGHQQVFADTRRQHLRIKRKTLRMSSFQR
ncbi:MAG: hypothetical protein ACXWU8_00315 [Rhodoplanes sp.]